MTRYYVFRGTTGTAQMVTDDKTGAKLPKHPVGSWVYFKELDLQPGEHRIGASSDDIIAGVAKNGYYRWPEPDPNEDKA